MNHNCEGSICPGIFSSIIKRNKVMFFPEESTSKVEDCYRTVLFVITSGLPL